MTPYELIVKRSAEKEMLSLPTQVFDRVKEAILNLEEDPRPRGCKKLRGLDEYRLRVGAYRVLFSVDDEKHAVTVMAVGHRQDVYRRRNS